ncbi:MAG: phosphate starvation-inducible protein PhoH, partial [Micromonosporaceae bacterium]|nr:phosphate starvation-inducible protein PhoH [Micromonosporaceae bacterium]
MGYLYSQWEPGATSVDGHDVRAGGVRPSGRPMTHTPPPAVGGAHAEPLRAQTKITVDDPHTMVRLLGAGDELLRFIERSVTSDVHVRGNEITITGAPADNAQAERIFAELLELIGKGETLTTDAVRRIVGMLADGTTERPADVLTLNILSRRGRTIRPKTLGQKRYVDAIDTHTIVFGIGPAGTGKTYLAMAKAVQALQAKQVNRIILTRPAVEAGERLGFLPGTL